MSYGFSLHRQPCIHSFSLCDFSLPSICGQFFKQHLYYLVQPGIFRLDIFITGHTQRNISIPGSHRDLDFFSRESRRFGALSHCSVHPDHFVRVNRRHDHTASLHHARSFTVAISHPPIRSSGDNKFRGRRPAGFHRSGHSTAGDVDESGACSKRLIRLDREFPVGDAGARAGYRDGPRPLLQP